MYLIDGFGQRLLRWYDIHGRKDLPWQHPRSAYRVWLSEIMLQQTQVQTVIPYFHRFLERFPDLNSLTQAHIDEVLALWAGLGYYSRARNLHKCAKIVFDLYQGEFPQNMQQLTALPGIGKSTAAAILSQAFGQQVAILDANVKRVLCRYFAVEGFTGETQVSNLLWQLAQQCMPVERCADYTQAIMDLGATCCTARAPQCPACPLMDNCSAYRANSIDKYPVKKKKPPLPIKQQQFLLLIDKHKRIFLHKRPPTGIWGGLWCLPHIETGLTVEDSLQQLSCKNGKPLQQTKFRHRFSHFQLDAEVWLIQVEFLIENIREPIGDWYYWEKITELGLPTPIKKLLDRFKPMLNAKI